MYNKGKSIRIFLDRWNSITAIDQNGGIDMSSIEAAKKLYDICRDMDIEETMELVLSAETEEQGDFFSLISDFILQRKQKEVIAQKEF